MIDATLRITLRNSLVTSLDSFDSTHLYKGERSVEDVLGYVRGLIRGKSSLLRIAGVITESEVEYIDKLIDASIKRLTTFPPRPSTLLKEPTA